MTTTTLGPVLPTTLPGSEAELCIVDRDTFGRYFLAARDASSRIADATSNTVPADDDTVYRLSADGLSGYVVSREGELTNVFSLVPGRGRDMVRKAVERDGADRLDCFDGYLPGLYAGLGFEEIGREPNWTPGAPDVVYMVRPLGKCECGAATVRVDGRCEECHYVTTRVGVLR